MVPPLRSRVEGVLLGNAQSDPDNLESISAIALFAKKKNYHHCLQLPPAAGSRMPFSVFVFPLDSCLADKNSMPPCFFTRL